MAAVTLKAHEGPSDRRVVPQGVKTRPMPVLYSRFQHDDRARVIDFGIALDYRDRRLTWGRLSNRLGTPEYMAPEQIRGRRGEARVQS
jgi:serine/threonine protein kinase